MKREKTKISYPWWVAMMAAAIAVLMVCIRL